MSLYLTLHEKAASLYPQDEKSRTDYVQGFVTKVANILSDLKYDSDKVLKTGGKDSPTLLGGSFADNFWARGVGAAAGKAVVGAGLAAGFSGLMSLAKVVSDHALHNNYLKALNEAVQSNSVLRGAEKSKVLNFGNTIFRFAPHVATDPNMLSSILANAVHGDGIDPMTIRTLTELESRFVQTKGEGNFNPKTWI